MNNRNRMIEWYWRWYESRLDNPSLLRKAVAVPMDDDGSVLTLAVPVGGRRRGGYLSVGEREHADHAFAYLSNREGFPRVRIEYASNPAICHVVRWGDDPPPLPGRGETEDAWTRSDVADGRFYGYSDAAIRAYLEGR